VAVLLSFFHILSLVPASPFLAFSPPLISRHFCLRIIGTFQRSPITSLKRFSSSLLLLLQSVSPVRRTRRESNTENNSFNQKPEPSLATTIAAVHQQILNLPRPTENESLQYSSACNLCRTLTPCHLHPPPSWSTRSNRMVLPPGIL